MTKRPTAPPRRIIVCPECRRLIEVEVHAKGCSKPTGERGEKEGGREREWRLRERLPKSLRQMVTEVQNSGPDWWEVPCPDCGAVAVVREHSMGMVHRKVGCLSDADRAADKAAVLAWQRTTSRWG